MGKKEQSLRPEKFGGGPASSRGNPCVPRFLKKHLWKITLDFALRKTRKPT